VRNFLRSPRRRREASDYSLRAGCWLLLLSNTGPFLFLLFFSLFPLALTGGGGLVRIWGGGAGGGRCACMG
jgi:hypothetical protein